MLLALGLLFALSYPMRADKLSVDERLEIERGLNAEFATMKIVLPRSKKPLVIESNGQHDQASWNRVLDEQGPAARVGDQVQITRVLIEAKRIVFEINGGGKTGHWYDHVEVGMGGNMGPISNGNGGQQSPNGSHIALVFPGPVPSITANDVRHMLSPVFDFEKRSASQQYVESLPAPIQKAIKEQKAD